MDFDVLPGPSLPELARTTLARAATATISVAAADGSPAAAGPVPVRSTRDGSPLLLPAAGSPLARRLGASPGPGPGAPAPAAPPRRRVAAGRGVAREPGPGARVAARGAAVLRAPAHR